MFELAAIEIHQAYRERELAAELRDRRLLKSAQATDVAATRERAERAVLRRTAPRISTADR
jgi:hypothetical protein